MSTVIIILLIAAIAYLALFHKPVNHTEAELEKWFSSRLEQISNNLDNDIALDQRGEYPHAGKQTFEKHGSITYLLLDKTGARFDVSDKNKLTSRHIMATSGYRKLESKVRQLKLNIHLEEVNVEGDGVESFTQLDEYVADFPRYYTVTISGW